MSQKRHTVDQIIAKLRRADVELGKGKTVPDACKVWGFPNRRMTVGVRNMEACSRRWQRN